MTFLQLRDRLREMKEMDHSKLTPAEMRALFDELILISHDLESEIEEANNASSTD